MLPQQIQRRQNTKPIAGCTQKFIIRHIGSPGSAFPSSLYEAQSILERRVGAHSSDTQQMNTVLYTESKDLVRNVQLGEVVGESIKSIDGVRACSVISQNSNTFTVRSYNNAKPVVGVENAESDNKFYINHLQSLKDGTPTVTTIRLSKPENKTQASVLTPVPTSVPGGHRSIFEYLNELSSDPKVSSSGSEKSSSDPEVSSSGSEKSSSDPEEQLSSPASKASDTASDQSRSFFSKVWEWISNPLWSKQ